MKVFSKISEVTEWRKLTNQQTVSLIPTMGALHQGHGFLIEEAKKNSDLIIVYIFPNPLQFSKNEDFDEYPSLLPGALEKDIEFCRKQGIDAVFAPKVEEIYPNGIKKITTVEPNPQLLNCLCGKARPGHFQGVLTVLLKFFNFIQPNKAFFGEKDYQQFLLVKQMIYDFNLHIEILPVKIRRESSGLALSSRNKYLSDEQKIQSAEIHQTLEEAKSLILQGKPASKIVKELNKDYFEYFEARDSETLEKKDKLPLRLFIAARIGKARLIDNIVVE
ncbi:MAG: pantoate--beta-alanine ligase [Candidatus Caenarcaniphilales bacterium]|nr:pantoate--beta-alanine ligase [Candidatus Caenarcaniphilales bacterium]